MKNLKKLVVISAILGATHGAKAFEKEFEPVKAGEATGIELVNGQLMIETKDGKIAGVNTPYVFVGTNTTNFAENAFAVKAMEDANSVLLDKENNNVYFTRSSTNGVYKMTVSDKKALNGVSGQLEFFESDKPVTLLTVKDGIAYAQKGNEVVDVASSSVNVPAVELPESASANLYSVTPEGYTYVLEKGSFWPNVVKYDGKTRVSTESWGLLKTDPIKEMVVFDDANIFVLKEDGSLLKNKNTINGKDEIVDAIKRSQDGKLLITSKAHGKTVVSSYDPKSQTETTVYNEAEPPKKPFNKTEVKANGLTYFVNKVNKKNIGYNY